MNAWWLVLIIIFALANGIVILTAGKRYRDRHRAEQAYRRDQENGT